jgi:hypothetical protein
MIKTPLCSLLLLMPAAILFADTTAHTCAATTDQAVSAPADIDQRIEALLSKLTIEEKIDMLGGDETGFNSRGIPRLGIPPLRMTDGPVGVRTGASNAYPVSINMAASWDTELVNRYGVALAEDTLAKGKNVILGTGGDSCTGTAGANGSTVTKSDDASGIGQKWEVANPDSPGGGILLVHPTDGAARLINFKFNIDFRCDLVFWTNRDNVSGPSNAPGARLYSSVQTNTWSIRLDSNFGPAYAETVVTAKTVSFSKDADATRMATPVDGSGLETRLPDGLNSLQADIPF